MHCPLRFDLSKRTVYNDWIFHFQANFLQEKNTLARIRLQYHVWNNAIWHQNAFPKQYNVKSIFSLCSWPPELQISLEFFYMTWPENTQKRYKFNARYKMNEGSEHAPTEKPWWDKSWILCGSHLVQEYLLCLGILFLGTEGHFYFLNRYQECEKNQKNWSSLKVSLSSELLSTSRRININFNIKFYIDTRAKRTIISTMLKIRYFAPFSTSETNFNGTLGVPPPKI